MTNFLKQALGHLTAAAEIYSEYRVTSFRTSDPRLTLNAPFAMPTHEQRAAIDETR